jgi:glycosyltransferase involved in cell wall biosynthesis
MSRFQLKDFSEAIDVGRIRPASAFISVIIPTFRRQDVLSELLTVLMLQLPGTNTEVLVVDNCPDQSASDLVLGLEHPQIHYFSEPRSGVVHARNKGLSEARGEYILFIDDDEVPSRNWLAAFTKQAEAGVVAAFGKITARYAKQPETDVIDLLEQMFTRKIDAESGADITARYADMGCGNALFHRATCFPDANPFSEEFNRLGGEDSALIEGLVNSGQTLHWVPDGLVEEVVPEDRQTIEYLKSRRFNQGRLRSKINIDRSLPKGAFWMAVGATQTTLYTTRFFLARMLGSSRKAAFYAVQIQGGLGKLFWWRQPATLRTYGG